LTPTISDSKTLLTAYEIIKSKQFNAISTVDNKILNNINSKWFSQTAQKLKNGSFQFKSVKRLILLKPNKYDNKSLAIYNFKDKIVQQAICIILEQIFEPEFLKTSNDFRTFRGCHSILKQIKMNWSGISWFLEFSIPKCFEEIDKKKLINILQEKIDDQNFLDLISQLFNVGILGWKINNFALSSKTFQNCSVFIILSNIYLHKLDLEINKIQKEHLAGKNRRLSNEYHNLTQILKTKKLKILPIEKQTAIAPQRIDKAGLLGLTRTDWNNPNFIRIRYVRHVDEFLFGIAGPKELVNLIKKRIIIFAKSNLNLELTGGKITHIASGKISFLGMEISAIPHSKFLKRSAKILEKKKRIKNRLALQRSVRDSKILKAIQLSLKKAIRAKSLSNPKDFPNLKKKFQALRKSIISDREFAKSSITSYKEFIKSLYSVYIFVPTSLENTLKEFELELKNWDDSLKPNILEHRRNSYKKLTSPFKTLPLKINAPFKIIREKLKSNNIISKANRPKAVHRLATQSDKMIVTWFRSIGQGLLNYYRCCNNFYKIKVYVDYFIRWSAIHTLSTKHRTSSKKIIEKLSKNLIIKDSSGFKLTSFINNNTIKSMGRKFITNVYYNTGLRILDTIWLKFTKSKWFGIKCSIKNCNENSPLKMYNINKLTKIKETFNCIFIITKKNKRIYHKDAFRLAYKYKQIPFCKKHHQLLNSKKISLEDLDWEYIKH
jgi:retron-type reverse transcriptase